MILDFKNLQFSNLNLELRIASFDSNFAYLQFIQSAFLVLFVIGHYLATPKFLWNFE